MLYFDTYESPVGTLLLTGTEKGLSGLSFSVDLPRDGRQAEGKAFAAVKNWLDDYFRGNSRQPDFALEPAGTAFQTLIWKLLLEIPFGETVTYGDLARQAAALMGKERMSAQAVGQAVGSNPIAIVIPCHRCVGAGGKLTGYAYGLEKKQWLLHHEQT